MARSPDRTRSDRWIVSRRACRSTSLHSSATISPSRRPASPTRQHHEIRVRASLWATASNRSVLLSVVKAHRLLGLGNTLMAHGSLSSSPQIIGRGSDLTSPAAIASVFPARSRRHGPKPEGAELAAPLTPVSTGVASPVAGCFRRFRLIESIDRWSACLGPLVRNETCPYPWDGGTFTCEHLAMIQRTLASISGGVMLSERVQTSVPTVGSRPTDVSSRSAYHCEQTSAVYSKTCWPARTQAMHPH